MKKIIVQTIFSWLFLATTQVNGSGQSIPLTNPSFEDFPRHSHLPAGWYNCGQTGETPPDVHPSGVFGVTKVPFDGSSYLGLVTRDNDTWEAVGQQLPVAMQAGQCYLFSLFAARSPTYLSLSRTSRLLSNYDQPVVLRIWGGSNACDRGELLSVSEAVADENWRLFAFFLQPKQTYTHLMVEAYPAPNEPESYNGNVLIDYLQPIHPVACGATDPALAEALLPSPAELGLPVDVEIPATRQDLEVFLRTVGPRINFLKTLPALEHWGYCNDKGEIISHNYYLQQLVGALQQWPSLTLIIAVDPTEHAAEWNPLRQGLLDELTALDAPPNVVVQKFHRRDRKLNWLWTKKENPRIYMRVRE